MIKLKYVVFHHLYNGVHTSLNLETLNALKKSTRKQKKKQADKHDSQKAKEPLLLILPHGLLQEMLLK